MLLVLGSDNLINNLNELQDTQEGKITIHTFPAYVGCADQHILIKCFDPIYK